MKKICVILVTLLSLTSIVKAQTLTNEFNVISTNNDMMGGTLVVFLQKWNNRKYFHR